MLKKSKKITKQISSESPNNIDELLNEKMKLTSKQEEVNQQPKKEKDYGKVSTYSLKVTKLELVHLRDLFNIKLPPNLETTISESLAELQSRKLIEEKLWKKISKLLVELDLPLEDNAPDFTLVPSGLAPVIVAQVEPTDTQMSNMLEKIHDEELDR